MTLSMFNYIEIRERIIRCPNRSLLSCLIWGRFSPKIDCDTLCVTVRKLRGQILFALKLQNRPWMSKTKCRVLCMCELSFAERLNIHNINDQIEVQVKHEYIGIQYRIYTRWTCSLCQCELRQYCLRTHQQRYGYYIVMQTANRHLDWPTKSKIEQRLLIFDTIQLNFKSC